MLATLVRTAAFSCPSTTSSGIFNSATPYWMLPSTAWSTTCPAVRDRDRAAAGVAARSGWLGRFGRPDQVGRHDPGQGRAFGRGEREVGGGRPTLGAMMRLLAIVTYRLFLAITVGSLLVLGMVLAFAV